MIYPASEKYIKFASDLIKDGEIIVYPTDTLYGLGVDATNTSAIRRLNRLKGRSEPLSIVISDLDGIDEFAILEDDLIPRLNQLFPGPFTILLEKKESRLSPNVTLNSPKVGLRIPDHEFPLGIVRHSGTPIITTSINRHSSKPIVNISEMESEFPQVVIFEDQDNRDSRGSTIIDFTESPAVIVRDGDGEFKF